MQFLPCVLAAIELILHQAKCHRRKVIQPQLTCQVALACLQLKVCRATGASSQTFESWTDFVKFMQVEGHKDWQGFARALWQAGYHSSLSSASAEGALIAKFGSGIKGLVEFCKAHAGMCHPCNTSFY